MKKTRTVEVDLAVSFDKIESLTHEMMTDLVNEADYHFTYPLIKDTKIIECGLLGDHSCTITVKLDLFRDADEDEVQEMIQEMDYSIDFEDAGSYTTQVMDFDAKLAIAKGTPVWWTDPDDNKGSGWYTVVDGADLEFVQLVNEHGSELEAPGDELSAEAPAVKDLVLQFANKAYENGELRLHLPLSDGERGDGLADFIRNELSDVLLGESDDPGTVQEIVRNTLESAIRQLEEVIEGICDNPDFEQLLMDRQNHPERPGAKASLSTIKASEPDF